MLRITTDQENEATVLNLEGKLGGPWVAELEKAWEAAKSASGGAKIRVHLRAVSYIDAAGRELLARMHREGAELAASGCLNRAILAEITGSWAPRRWCSSAGKKTLLFVFLLGLLFARVSPAQDQPAQKPALRLTLREAVSLALKQNPQVQIALLNAAQSEQDKDIALSALLPRAQLKVSDAVVRGNVETSLGHGVPTFPQHFGPFQIFQAGPQFSMPLLDLTLWRRWQASRQAVLGSQAQQQSVREQVVLLVVSQYLGTLRAAADVRAAHSRVDLAQALYHQAADLQKHGVGTGIDTLRANVELQNEKQRLLVAETQHKTALYGLGRLLNLDAKQTIESLYGK